ncbi:MAG: helix-turn-helix domain-containing protein [Bacteroidales bacterium]|nr:helix-turn-helix domain-containing protein [Bacteroidales bacterium]
MEEQQKTSFDSMPDAVDRMIKQLSEIKAILIDWEIMTPEPEENELLTIDEAAKLLHLRTPTIYSKVSRGELPGVSKRNGRLYFDKQVLIDWIKSGSKKTSSEVEAEAAAFLNSQRKGVR